MPKVELPERRKDAETETPSTSAAPAAPSTVRRSRAGRRWLIRLCALCLAIFILLPTLLSIFGQIPGLISKVHPRLAETLQFRTIQLHWWSAIEIKGLRIRDVTANAPEDDSSADVPGDDNSTYGPDGLPDGRYVFSSEVVTSREPLWRVALQMGRGVELRFQQPVLNLVVRDDGSNLQKTLQHISGSSGVSHESFPVRVIFEDGTAFVQSVASDVPGLQTGDAVNSKTTSPTESTRVTNINGVFSTLDSTFALPELQLEACINVPENSEAGGSIDHALSSASQLNPRLAANLDDLTADFTLSPLIDPQGEFDKSALFGQQDGVSPDGPTNAGSRLRIQITGSDTVNSRQSAGSGGDNTNTNANSRQRLSVAARELDLRVVQPLLSYLVPDLLCDGQVSCDVQAELGGHRIADGLVGRFLLQGQNIRLRQNTWAAGEWLDLGNTSGSGAGAFAVDGLLLKDITLQSDIVSLRGNGELRHAADESATAGDSQSSAPNQSAELQGSVDVAGVTRMLRSTLALRNDVQIQAGQLVFSLNGEVVGDAAGETDHAASSLARWQASIRHEGIQATQAGKSISLDPSLRIDAVGPLESGLPVVRQSRLTGAFGSLDLSPGEGFWQIAGNVQPDLLWQQIQQFVQLPRPGIRGGMSVQARIGHQSDRITLSGLQLNSSDLKVSSSQLTVFPQNPVPQMFDGSVHLKGTGSAIRTLIAPWHSATWLAEYADVTVELAAQPQKAIQLQARIQPIPAAAAVGTPVRSVSARRTPTVSTAKEVSTFQIDEAIIDLQLQNMTGLDVLDVRSGRLLLPGIAAQFKGTVSTISDLVVVDLTAETEYDLNALCNRLLPEDTPIRLNGRGRDIWKITGAPAVLSAETYAANAGTTRNVSLPAGVGPLQAVGGITWQSGRAWGLALGSSQVKATLENGIVRTEPIECAVNSGSLTVMPLYDLIHDRVQMATGSRIENLPITPELCRQWLGYLAPMMADSANVSGEVSARVERFDYHLNQPEASDIAATISIHHAEAAPGASLQSLLETLDVIRRLGKSDRSSLVRSVVLPQQQIPIALRQGVVTHQGLIIELSGYRAQTSGAVGLNRQLQIMLDVPLEKATGGNDFRSIRIPVRGTIDSPQPDTAGLLQNLGTQSIQNNLNNQLNKQFNKLLDKL
ncbi:MAG: hypothetical protein R3C20_11975 [Planctomycetaceae bacterium]